MTVPAVNAALAVLVFLSLLGVAAVGAAQPPPVAATVRKPANWIKPQQQVREDYGTEAEQRLFGESVRERQLQPLVCLADGTLVCGYRRFHCGLLVGMTEFDVTVITDPLTESQVKIYRLTENIQRKDLSAWETFQSCAELMRLNESWQLKDLARHLRCDASTVTRYLSPGRCIEPAQQALRAGKIGISDCYALAKLEHQDQYAVLSLKLSTGASRNALEAAGRKIRTTPSAAPAPRTGRLSCLLKSGYTVTVSGTAQGVSLDDAVEALADAIKEMKHARDLGYTAKTFILAMKDKSLKG